jgi:TldD protein
VTQSRRDFLKATSAAAAALGVTTAMPRAASALGDRHFATAVGDPAIRALALRAVDAAKSAGAEYADVRISQQRNQSISTRERRVQNLADNETMGFGVRAC